MAPEVINGKQYDTSADIWSFGITALELTQGRPPRSREKPHNLLLHIVQNPPPILDRSSNVHKYSKSFQDIISSCLNKDPNARPSAQELLQTHFFRGGKKKGYLVGTILKGLPPLTNRQERRKQPSIITHATMDSWDFGSTVGGVGSAPTSPTESVYGPHKPGGRSMRRVPSGSVFEFEDEDDVGEGGGVARGPPRSIDSTSRGDGESASAYANRIKYGMARHSSRGVSWVMSEEEEEEEEEEEGIPTGIPNITTTEYVSSSSSPSDTRGLPVPKRLHESSTPPIGSSYSSATSSVSTSAGGGGGEPVTPPSLSLPSFWRKLRGGWGEDKDKEKEKEKEKDRHLHPHHRPHSLREKEKEQTEQTEQPTRKKPFGGSMLYRSSVAAAGAVLVRSVSRNQRDGGGGGSPTSG